MADKKRNSLWKTGVIVIVDFAFTILSVIYI